MADPVQHLAEVRNLSVSFPTRRGVMHAVRGVSWHVDRGETLAILGESGSGKSVSAAAFMGLLRSPPAVIEADAIRFKDTDLLNVSAEGRRRINGRKIGMIFQDTLAALNPVYPVGWQVAETMRAHGVGRAEAHQRALDLLNRVGIANISARAGDYPHQFSGGQRQRIMIAMAIALGPDLLIADEPTSSLDVTLQAQILELLRQLMAETGMGMLLITHDMSVVAKTANRIAVMNQGEIVETGTVDDVLKHPSHPYTRKLINAIPGRGPIPQPRPRGSDKPLLEVRGIVKHYPLRKPSFLHPHPDTIKAVDGVGFDLYQGETLGIVGESGSGKSTLTRVLLGLAPPQAGTALFRQKNLFGMQGAELKAMRRRIQVVFQDPTASLNPWMTVNEIISEPWIIHPGIVPPAEHSARVTQLLEQVGLEAGHAYRYPHEFSGGQRQRIAIARALALQPELIICDEAVSALDVSVQAQIMNLLKKLRADLGLSYIFVAHDLSVVRDFADHVMVLFAGKVVEAGTTAEVFEHPREVYTQQLLAASLVLNAEAPAAAPTDAIPAQANA